MNYFEKANLCYNNKDYETAFSLYKKSIEIKQNEAASLYNSAVCLIKLKAYGKAIILIKRALKLKRDSRYFFNLGYCYALLNNNGKALIYFNTAWSINNEDSDCEKAINMIVNHYRKNII